MLSVIYFENQFVHSKQMDQIWLTFVFFLRELSKPALSMIMNTWVVKTIISVY